MKRLDSITRRFALKAAVATAAIALGGFAAQAQETIKVGLVTTTGTILGKQGLQAAEIALKMVNDKGGVNGKPLELVVYDDNNTPVEAVGAVQKLIDEDGIKIIIGPNQSTNTLAVLPIITAENALLIAPPSKHPKVTASGYDKVFRLNSTVAMDGATFGDFIRNEMKPESVAYVGDNNEVGRMFLDGVKAMFPDDPKKVVWEQFYDASTTDFSGLLTSAKGSGADTFFIGGTNVEQYGNILRTAKELNYAPKNVVLSAGLLNARAVDLAAGGAEGVTSSDIYLPNVENDLNKAFVTAYTAQLGYAPEKLEALWFESVTILAEAMNKAGTSDDLDKIAAAIRDTTWNSVRGEVKFDATGQALSSAFIVKVVDGVIVRQ